MGTEQQHAIGILTVYGISAHQLDRKEALEIAQAVADDPANAEMYTTAEVFGAYDRALHLKRTGPVAGRG